MRVIAGSAKGCKLKAPEGLQTRPTADRIKETMYNILSPELIDADVMDIFSGSGALAIEALSRGARYAAIIDNDKQSISVIKENLKKTRLSSESRLMEEDAFHAMEILSREGYSFDIIMMDPPYGQGLVQQTIKKILEYGLIKPDGIIMAEQGSDEKIFLTEGLHVFKEKIYKTMRLIFYRAEGVKHRS